MSARVDREGLTPAAANAASGEPKTGSPLRVLVAALGLGVGGGGTFIVEQIAALSEHEDLELTVMAAPDLAAGMRAACSGRVRVRELSFRGPAARLLYEQAVVPFKALGYDVVYQPGGFAIFASPRPQAVTNQNPHHFGSRQREFWRERYPGWLKSRMEVQWRLAHASVRRAEAFISVSGAFRDLIEQDMGLRENLHTVRSAEPDYSMPAPGRSGIPAGPYVLSVAHDYRHKDWDGLIDVFLRHRDLPRLVLVGACRHPSRLPILHDRVRRGGGADRVVLVGAVSDRARIAALYRGAACFVAHSFLEAGPLTPREALASGLRLVASDIGPHREAAGEDAIYYSPWELDSLAEALRVAAAGATETARRSEWAPRHWRENAQEIADLLHSIAAGRVAAR